MAYNRKLIIKQNVLSEFIATVRDCNGDIVDLSAYDSVKFVMIDSSDVVKVNAVATFIDKTAGTVSYEFIATDVDTVGNFKAYFLFYTGADKKLASPPTYFDIQITEDYLP